MTAAPAAMALAPLLTCLLLLQASPAVRVLVALVLGVAAFHRPATVIVWLMPIGLVGAWFGGGSRIALGAMTVVALVTACHVAAGALRLRAAHLLVGLLALGLLVSFAFPAATPAGAPPGRLHDLQGLLAGLAILAAVIAAAPPPRPLAQAIATAGGLTACWVLVAGDHVHGRLEGLGLNPNYLGALLAAALVAAVGLLRTTRTLPWLIPAAACGVAVLGTQSRGALLAAVVGVTVILVQGRSRRPGVLIMAAASVVLVVSAGPDPVERSVVGDRPPAELHHNSAVRRDAGAFAVSVTAEHPLRGIGYGMFPPYVAHPSRLGIYIAPHNDYLRLAAEAGVPVLAGFLILLWSAIRGRRTGDLGVLRAVVLSYCVVLLFAGPLGNPVVCMAFWLSLGCLAATPERTPYSHHSVTGSVENR